MNTDLISNQSIPTWSLEDRPREKLITKGKNALTNAELLAIIIGSGHRNESAVGLMQRVLRDNENDLKMLSKRSVEELTRYKGIGTAKAVSIVAMLELGRRREKESCSLKIYIHSSQEAYQLIKPDLEQLQHEEMWLILMNRAARVIKKLRVSSGGIAGTVVDPKMVFKIALDHRASSLILAHNHPSGSNNPSSQDLSITRKIVEAGKVLDIFVHDHIIIGDDNYYSFADEGRI